MAQLMLVNPAHRKRYRRKATTARRRAPRRRALSANPTRRRRKRRMSAAQRMFFGKRRRAAKSNPHRRRRRRALSVVARSNPVRRRRRRSMKANPHRRRMRRNPIGFNIKSFLKGTVVPSAIGAIGAIGIDALWGMAPIPVNIKASPYAPAFKILGIGLLNAFGGKFVGRANADVIAGTAIAIQIYNLAKPKIAAYFPSITLGDVGWTQAGQFLPNNDMNGMGAYISGMGGDAAVLPWSSAPYGEEIL